MSVAAVIVAGGTGERFGSPGGKQLAPLAGKPVLAWTVAAFEACDRIDSIVVVADPGRLPEYAEAASSPKVAAVVAGGEERQHSVANGLSALPAGVAVVAVHDGARPLVTPSLIACAVDALEADSALAGAVVGHPQSDTLKRAAQGLIAGTIARAGLWAVQTPQVFRTQVLRDAYASAEADGFLGTDDASLVERIGGRVRLVRGPRDNIKVTVPEDLVIAEAVLAARMEHS